MKLSVEASVVSPHAVLVNWTLDMGDKADKGDKVQLEIVYSPVQARCVQSS